MGKPIVHLNRGDGWPLCRSFSDRLTTSFDAVTCPKCNDIIELHPA